MCGICGILTKDWISILGVTIPLFMLFRYSRLAVMLPKRRVLIQVARKSSLMLSFTWNHFMCASSHRYHVISCKILLLLVNLIVFLPNLLRVINNEVCFLCGQSHANCQIDRDKL